MNLHKQVHPAYRLAIYGMATMVALGVTASFITKTLYPHGRGRVAQAEEAHKPNVVVPPPSAPAPAASTPSPSALQTVAAVPTGLVRSPRVSDADLQRKGVAAVRLPIYGLVVLAKKDGALVWRQLTPDLWTRVKYVLGALLSFGLATPWLTCMYYRQVCEREEVIQELRFTGKGGELLKVYLWGWALTVVTLGVWALLGYPQEAVADYVDSKLVLVGHDEKGHDVA